jgi:hypothetical protein
VTSRINACDPGDPIIVPILVQLGAVVVEDLTEIGAFYLVWGDFFTEGEGGGVADGVAVGEALGGDAGGGDGFVLRGEAATGEEEVFAALGDEAGVGDFVDVVEEPFDLGFVAGVEFDGPGGTGDAVLEFFAGEDVGVLEGCDALGLAGLADADLGGGVVEEGAFAAGEIFDEELGVGLGLVAAFDFGLGDIFGE